MYTVTIEFENGSPDEVHRLPFFEAMELAEEWRLSEKIGYTLTVYDEDGDIIKIIGT